MPKKPIAIEALLAWTYRDQRADHWWTSHQGLMPGEVAVQTKTPQLRLTVGGSLAHEADDQSSFARMLVPWQIDDDAKAVHELVLRLPSRALQSALVVAGRRGRRPELLAAPRFVGTDTLHPATQAEAETWRGYMRGPRRGLLWRHPAAAQAARALDVRSGVLLAPTVSHPRSKRPAACELRLDPDPRDWFAARAAYETWRSGLELLAWFLRAAGLARHAVTEELPPPAPAVPPFVSYFLGRVAEGHPDGLPLGARRLVPDDLEWSMVGVKGRRWTRPAVGTAVNAERG